MKLARRVAGARAQSAGASFENLFQSLCRRQAITVTRIPDACRQVSSNRLIRVRSPWDWVLSWNSRTALIDTKTTQESTFAHSAIHRPQAKELCAHNLAGAIAGYVIWMRAPDRMIYVTGRTLLALSMTRGSISHIQEQVVDLGTSTASNLQAIFMTNSV